MTNTPEDRRAALIAAVGRIEAVVAKREHGARDGARRPGRASTFAEEMEWATVPDLKCADLRLLLDALSSSPAPEWSEVAGAHDEYRKAGGKNGLEPWAAEWFAKRAAAEGDLEVGVGLSPAPTFEQSSQGEGWRPIETAPRDGTPFDAWIPDAFGGRRMTSLSFNWRGQLRQHGLLSSAELPRWPTHWRPIPSPPLPAVADGEGHE